MNNHLLIYWIKVLCRIIWFKDLKGIKIHRSQNQTKKSGNMNPNICSIDLTSSKQMRITNSRNTGNNPILRIKISHQTLNQRVPSFCKMMSKLEVSYLCRANITIKIWCQTSKTHSCQELLEQVVLQTFCKLIQR